jgi:hypothetical protein
MWKKTEVQTLHRRTNSVKICLREVIQEIDTWLSVISENDMSPALFYRCADIDGANGGLS